MKRIVLFVITCLVSAAVFAQSKMPTAEELAKKNVDEIDKRVTLSATQKSVVYNYAFNLAKEQVNLIKQQQATGYKEEDIAKFYRLNNEININIRAVLKPEQIKEYNKLIEERLNGTDRKKKKKKRKKEDEEEVVGIEGLKSVKGIEKSL